MKVGNMNKLKYLLSKNKVLKETEQYRKSLYLEPSSTNADLLPKAAIAIIDNRKASCGMLQRIFAISFSRANLIMTQLENLGIVGKETKYFTRDILITDKSKALSIINQKSVNTCPDNFDKIDNMEGHDFEYFCADILRKNRFAKVEVTQGSGDHGIDILAEKDGISYAIQCKCYSSNVGNAAIQQAHTGKSLYHKDIAVVLTNQYFTQQAINEASALGVKLWDREHLINLIGNAENRNVD